MTNDVQPEKKGKRSWQPAKSLALRNKKPGYRYRFVTKDDIRIQNKIEEGWVPVNKTTGVPAELTEDARRGDGGHGDNMTGALEYREFVVMALDEDTAKQRDAYYDEQTRKQTAGLKSRLIENMERKAGKGRAAPIHGKIVIE